MPFVGPIRIPDPHPFGALGWGHWERRKPQVFFDQMFLLWKMHFSSQSLDNVLRLRLAVSTLIDLRIVSWVVGKETSQWKINEFEVLYIYIYIDVFAPLLLKTLIFHCNVKLPRLAKNLLNSLRRLLCPETRHPDKSENPRDRNKKVFHIFQFGYSGYGVSYSWVSPGWSK